jgi:hypothetical protein
LERVLPESAAAEPQAVELNKGVKMEKSEQISNIKETLDKSFSVRVLNEFLDRREKIITGGI